MKSLLLLSSCLGRSLAVGFAKKRAQMLFLMIAAFVLVPGRAASGATACESIFTSAPKGPHLPRGLQLFLGGRQVARQAMVEKASSVDSVQRFSDLLFDVQSARLRPEITLPILEATPLVKYYQISDEILLRLATRTASKNPDPTVIEAELNREFPGLNDGLKSRDHKLGYDIELEPVTVRDQCQDTCWLESFLSEEEYAFKAQTGYQIELSADYMLLRQTRERAIRAIRTGRMDHYYGNGGDREKAMGLARKFGVIPKSAWRPKQSPQSKHWEDYEWAREITQIVHRAHRVPANQRAKYEQEVDELLTGRFGELPDFDSFPIVVGDKSFTPRSLHLQLLGSLRSKSYSNKDTTRLTLVPSDWSLRTQRVSDIEIENLIFSQLKRGHPVPISYAHLDAPIDENGALHLSHVTKAGNHAALITGAERGLDGRLRFLKIQNSWGIRSGDRGFLHMSGSYFRSQVNFIEIYD